MTTRATAPPDPTTPVIVGVGQFLQREIDAEVSPIDLIVAATEAAATDSGSPRLIAAIDTIAVTPIVSWRYQDPGRLIAAQIGASPTMTLYPTMGGNTPQMLMNRICGRISNGESAVALLCGAEAYRTRMRAKKSDIRLDWHRQSPDERPGWTDGESFVMGHAAEFEIGAVMPAQTYPMFENALRHRSGRSAEEHTRFIAELWAGFSAVAATNPYAWDRTAYSAEEIATVTPDNRMVATPYTKHMVSNPDVDMASAVVVCSVQAARDAGIDESQWVFAHSGADTKDPTLSERPSLTGSAAIRHGGQAALAAAGITIDEVNHLDVYSCFPSAVEIACGELGIDMGRTLTVYGGLCFAGGPWNNPVGHAIASMVAVLRTRPGDWGLVTANGGNIQKHSFGVYSTEPPAAPFRSMTPDDLVAADGQVMVDSNYEGRATIEGWTVMHERDGSIGRSHALLRTPDGARTWAANDSAEVGAALMAGDPTGLEVTIGADRTLHL